MAYVITSACSGAKYTNCVDVCPVNAFREGEDMLFIDPDVCISCNACLTECPERAIYPEASVPEDQIQYIEINAVESKRHPIITERRVEGKADEPAPIASTKRFAVIGAGPSGFFSSEALLKQYPGAKIDLIDKLPTPFGLVRFGVAPDHPDIKSVTENYTQLVKNNPSLKYYGNVELGKDIDRAFLLENYDAVIYTTGGSLSKALPIAGGSLSGVYGSAEFVGWYNGHPEHANLEPKLNKTTLSIIGMGNVALDIARVVCLPKDELHATDIAEHALNAITNSKIKTVNLIARKGPAQAAFTPKELRQLINHPGLRLEIDPKDLQLCESIEASLALPKNSEAKENIELLRGVLHSSQDHKSDASKTIRFVFNSNPEEVIGTTRSVKGLQVSINDISLNDEQRLVVKPTGEKRQLESGIIISATGYQGRSIEGLKFDEQRGIIANENGRVFLTNGQLSDKEYVAGWIKRGANGVIGTNKQCAVSTVKNLAENLSDNTASLASETTTLKKYLCEKGTEYFSFADWVALDAQEIKLGMRNGRPRQKLTDVNAMVQAKRENQALIATATPTEDDVPGTKDYDATKPIKFHHRTCTLCEAMCGIVVEYQGEKIISIAGDEEDKHSHGHICPKGYALQDLHNDPERLKTPKKRIGDQWIDIDWDEALEEVARRIVATQTEYGNDSVAAYWGNPSSHNIEVMINMGPFKKALGSRNLFSASSLDQMPHMLTSYLMYGHSMSFTIPDIDHTDYMLMLGANPAASNGSLMTAGDVLGRLEKIKTRGGKLVLIDPRRTETALYASEHQFIKPGSDALFLLGLIQVIFKEGLVKQDIRFPLNGEIKDILPLVDTIPLAKIAELTQVPEKEIIRIATEFATAERAVCYGRMGVATQEFGALNHWLIQLLNIITGNLDSVGGMMFTSPAIDMTDFSGRGSFASFHSRVRKLPEFNRELPSATLADEMLTPGKGQVKAFVVTAGNPAISTPNGARLEKALAQLDFMVAIDFYINETTRHADIILPPCGPFEHALYDLAFTNLAVRNVTRFSDPLFKKKSYMRSDAQIYTTLTNRIEELKAGKPSKLKQAQMKKAHIAKALMTVERVIDLGLRNGRYGDGMKSFVTNGGLTLEKLKKHKHGLDLGPLKPSLPRKLFTKDKKVNLLPEEFVADLARLNDYIQRSDSASPLTLIGRRDLRTNNSWMHNSQRLVKGKNRCDLFIHPETAKNYSIEHGEEVYITSDVGALKVTVAITEDIMPNVVSLPHGWGHHRKGMKISVASSNPGVSVNDITDHSFVDELSGNAALNGVPVQLQKIF
ncbi:MULTISPECIES: molybdopterin-dependent oxidoreductase [Alteromonas]|jgi:anaerobic selenocysteine-containing dehydrogenase/NAD-dependent dihydropyrimidine dehydrogenase PreA subunit|uniref:molybdopterin-dependent oxidoreductase n=1 Tax=Alteromonas TaxID=226 RepID=UPI001EF38EB3|nr:MULTISPECIES: molybdopterin-dependent oxidoreductase [Alteromonas]MCG7639780.1 molybdopterin-dependent oxidoreductase [Alteromonas sp. CNT1-28]MCG7813957.1 molybdopterin-dependent oxidoreductase [Alteromonas sp. MCA-1]MCZ4242344.1 molybdopterin-dependent oxidoreductase [Alteromonas macleodii]